MQIKLFTSFSSSDCNVAYGEITDKIGDEDAKRLIERGLAEEIKPAKKAPAKKAK